jgi:hypothetical protein
VQENVQAVQQERLQMKLAQIHQAFVNYVKLDISQDQACHLATHVSQDLILSFLAQVTALDVQQEHFLQKLDQIHHLHVYSVLLEAMLHILHRLLVPCVLEVHIKH